MTNARNFDVEDRLPKLLPWMKNRYETKGSTSYIITFIRNQERQKCKVVYYPSDNVLVAFNIN